MNAISRPRRYGVWIVLALAVGGGAAYWFTRSKDTKAATLETSAISRGDLIESIASTGQLSAQEEVTVGSQVSGTITKVLVDFNSPVKKGDLMAVVDPQTLQAQVTNANAALLRAQANYNEAVKQFEEGKPLHEQGYLSDKDMRTLEVAIQTNKAQLAQAQSDFDKNNVQLQYAEIRSPMDGIVMTRSVDPGNTVQSSMNVATLFTVASDLSQMKILATVDETQIPSIKEGMKARFTVSGIADRTFSATVKQVRLKSTTTNNVVTYTVVLDAENPDKLLFPGMTATIDFILSSTEGKLLIPSSALRLRMPDALRADGGQKNAQGPQGAPGKGQGPGGPPAGMPGANGGFAGGNRPGGQMGQAPMQGAGGMPAMGGPQQMNAVWKLNAEGKAYRVPVRVLSSDLTNTAVEPLNDELKEGDMIVTRVIEPATAGATPAAANQNQNRNMNFGGPGGAVVFGGMGPGG